MNSWQQEYRDSLKTKEELESFFEVSIPNLEFDQLIPRSFAKKIKDAGEGSALWKQFIPSELEVSHPLQESGLYDPIGDKEHERPGGLVHRYKNRVLFFPTKACPIICRYCFRKNELSSNDSIFTPKLNEALTYLKEHPEVNEIIFSGGDPLMLSNEKILKYAQEFSKLGTIKYLRFHTRTPIILPSRIDEDFAELMLKISKLFTRINLAIHVNHPEEIDLEVKKRLIFLRDKGINMLSQTVLLSGINDSLETLTQLFEMIASFGIQPYYLHHPDQVKGGMHYFKDIEAGRRLFAQLRSQLPGWAIPTYILDIPGGKGKTPLFNSEAFEFTGKILDLTGKKVSIKF